MFERHQIRWILGLFTLSMAVVPACSSDSPTVVELQDPVTLTYAPALGVDLSTMTRTSSGLYMKDLVVGVGDAAASNDLLVVDYDGWTHDGLLFDTSRQPGRNALLFVPAEGRLIAGWIEGVVGMQVGGTRQLVIPPQLAYGDQRPSPTSPVPPGSVLIFELVLVDLNPEAP